MELSYQQTAKFQLNSSTSKQQYLFPKSKRFPTEKNNKQNVRFYTLTPTVGYNESKAPAFPKLKRKLQFPNQRSQCIVPSPSTYSLKSDIEKSISKKNGISIPKFSLKKITSSRTPAPSTYTPIIQPFPTQRYTIGKSRKKFQFPLQMQKGNSSPGPAYLVNVSKLQKVIGKFVEKKCMKVYSVPVISRLSKLNNSVNPQNSQLLTARNKLNKSSIIDESSIIKKSSILGLQSNKKPNNNKPQPTKVQSSRQLTPLNLTENVSVMGKFGKEQRKTIFEIKNVTPGPRYNCFSEFSKLQKKVYREKLKGNNIKKQSIK